MELALRVAPKVARSEAERVEKLRDKAKRNALGQDAMNEANPRFAPAGSWTTARGGSSGRDRGSRGSLTG